MNPDKIRIAYLIDSLRIGGTENQLADLVARLDRQRFEPVIICIRSSDSGFVDGVRCEVEEIRFGSFRSLGFLSALRRLVRFLRSRRIDIVQTFFIDATIFGITAAKLARVKKIISSRRDLGFWYDTPSLRAFSIVNRWVDRFWVNSEAVARQMERYERVARGRVDVIHNGIDLELFDRTGGEDSTGGGDSPVVGIVANLNRKVKRVDLFVRSAALVAKRCPEVRFTVVGDGAFRAELESLARELGAAERISFLGSRTDIPRLLSGFDVGILCSDSEGFSNSIIEYFAMGVPVVATDVGGNGELVEQGVNGFLVAKGDHRALADQMFWLLEHEDRRREMGARGRRKVEQQFAWPVKIREIEDYYRSLLAGTGG